MSKSTTLKKNLGSNLKISDGQLDQWKALYEESIYHYTYELVSKLPQIESKQVCAKLTISVILRVIFRFVQFDTLSSIKREIDKIVKKEAETFIDDSISFTVKQNGILSKFSKQFNQMDQKGESEYFDSTALLVLQCVFEQEKTLSKIARESERLIQRINECEIKAITQMKYVIGWVHDMRMNISK